MVIANKSSSDSERFKAYLESNQFDFLDFGCGIGGSMLLAQQLFDGKRGLGLDISEDKVKKAVSKGFDAFRVDLIDIALLPKFCRFAMISHFLEHLPSIHGAKSALRNAIALSRDFVFVQQPYFDADGLLFKDGYKLYWSDWHGHPNRMTSLEFHNILSRFLEQSLISRYVIYADKPIKKASNSALHPINSPINQNVYDQSIHPTKRKRLLPFHYPIYHEIKVLIEIDESQAIKKYESKIDASITLFDSEAG